MIVLKEAKSKKEMRAFVKFPFSIYKENSYWVPPIIKDELANFNTEINPVFKHATAQFFLAYRNNKIVGRVAAIINWTEINEQKVKKMRFGWFDIIDDITVSEALLNKVKEIGKANNLEFIEGPVGFSNLDKVGVLTKGYDSLGTMITWYNHPYYVEHLEALGLKKAKGYLEHAMDFKNIIPHKFKRISKIIQSRLNLHLLEFTKSSDIMPYSDEMFDLFNKSYAELSSFVPVSEDEKTFLKKKYIKLIDPEFIKFVANKDGKLVAFAITLPSFSKALQKANGKLFPLGIYHILKSRKSNDTAIFYLIGIAPEYKGKGVVSIIFESYFNTYQKKGIKKLLRTPELEENTAINQLWTDFQPVNHKKRSTYSMPID